MIHLFCTWFVFFVLVDAQKSEQNLVLSLPPSSASFSDANHPWASAVTLHGLKHEHMEIDPEISSANGKHVQVLVAAGLYVLKSLIKIHQIFLTKNKIGD